MMVQLLSWKTMVWLAGMAFLFYCFYWIGYDRGFKEGKHNGYAKGIRQSIRSSE